MNATVSEDKIAVASLTYSCLPTQRRALEETVCKTCLDYRDATTTIRKCSFIEMLQIPVFLNSLGKLLSTGRVVY